MRDDFFIFAKVVEVHVFPSGARKVTNFCRRSTRAKACNEHSDRSEVCFLACHGA